MSNEIFTKIYNDKNRFNFQKMSNKYPKDFSLYFTKLKEEYYQYLPFYLPLVYLPQKTETLHEEIIYTLKIENINNVHPKMLEGYHQAFDFIFNIENEINQQNLFYLYNLIIAPFLDDDQQLLNHHYYRHDTVYIGSHQGILAKDLPKAMDDLFSFIHQSDQIPPFTKASIIHFYFCYLHPYFDGNGRMARLLHLWYLYQHHHFYLPFSKRIYQNKQKYYQSFSQIEDNQRLFQILDVTLFIDFFNQYIYLN